MDATTTLTRPLPEHDDWAPFRARLTNTAATTTALSIYNHAQTPARTNATVFAETHRTTTDAASRIELLDELLTHYGYRRTSKTRILPVEPDDPKAWALFCDVYPIQGQVAGRV